MEVIYNAGNRIKLILFIDVRVDGLDMCLCVVKAYVIIKKKLWLWLYECEKDHPLFDGYAARVMSYLTIYILCRQIKCKHVTPIKYLVNIITEYRYPKIKFSNTTHFFFLNKEEKKLSKCFHK